MQASNFFMNNNENIFQKNLISPEDEKKLIEFNHELNEARASLDEIRNQESAAWNPDENNKEKEVASTTTETDEDILSHLTPENAEYFKHLLENERVILEKIKNPRANHIGLN